MTFCTYWINATHFIFTTVNFKKKNNFIFSNYFLSIPINRVCASRENWKNLLSYYHSETCFVCLISILRKARHLFIESVTITMIFQRIFKHTSQFLLFVLLNQWKKWLRLYVFYICILLYLHIYICFIDQKKKKKDRNLWNLIGWKRKTYLWEIWCFFLSLMNFLIYINMIINDDDVE